MDPVQDLSHLQWRAPEYLLSLPTGQLSSNEFAMDYFTLSPFFDKHSNNNQLRMQLMFSRGGIQGVNEQEELKRFVGVEYVISERDSKPPNLFIIHKRNRTSPTTTTIISVYHILNANVYQAPTVYTVLNERILTSLHALESSMTDLIQLKPQWTPETLYHWNIAPPPSSLTTTNALKSSLDADQSSTMEEEVVDTQRVEDGEDEEGREQKKRKLEEGQREERKPDEFNPLLFKALQGLGRKLQAEQV
ncbi:mediator complex subunit MED6 [Sporobolomyces salmoneus]|uniref:mediator complex subunit MED6 n=1 Tax=Sporobolomyces salmoneus TaxID=183962 RepID=UPI003177893F